MFSSFKLLLLLCCGTFCNAFAATDPCSSIADLQSKSDSSVFVGFGAGESQNAASRNARVDLARNIRQNVSASDTVTATDSDQSLNSTSSSSVSEILVGAQVLKRCTNQDNFSVVVTLSKKIFVSALQEKLRANLAQANSYSKRLKNSKNEASLMQTIDKAKKFLAKLDDSFDTNLALCRTYDGCSKVEDGSAFSDLADLLAEAGEKGGYVLVLDKGSLTQSFKDELSSLLAKDDVNVKDPDSVEDILNVTNRANAKCVAQVGTKIPNSSDRVVTVRCSVEGVAGKQKMFRSVFSCKAMIDERESKDEEAAGACSGRLQKET